MIRFKQLVIAAVVGTSALLGSAAALAQASSAAIGGIGDTSDTQNDPSGVSDTPSGAPGSDVGSGAHVPAYYGVAGQHQT